MAIPMNKNRFEAGTGSDPHLLHAQERATRLRLTLDALHTKDIQTWFHSFRVASLSVSLAEWLSVRDLAILKALALAALMHDIGKIEVPTELLLKVGPLNLEEAAVMRGHPALGEAILRSRQCGSAAVLTMVRHHHEAWNGGGYPDSLAGTEILLGARIIAVADAYDAMTSGRPYQAAMSQHGAIALLEQGSGKRWDPLVVSALSAWKPEE